MRPTSIDLMADGPRILTLAWSDALDESSLSGMPWNMRQALGRAGCAVEVAEIGALGTVSPPRVVAARAGILRYVRDGVRGCYESLLPGRVRNALEKKAVEAARCADEAILRSSPDIVFGPCMSRPIGFMETSTPILYASDATATLLLKTYDVYRTRGSGWRRACLDFETAALGRADRIAVSSDFTRRSAIEDHHADPTRVSVVPMGANVEIAQGTRVEIPADSPTIGDLRLLLVAADPERKQLDLCIEIIDELRARGWNAKLHYIGPERPVCGHEAVDWAGALRLGDPEDRARHQELLRTCHLAILPSRAEMFGISPIESAGFGRPAVVSDVGGLPTVVKDGVTGRVVPVDSPSAIWCDAIEAMVSRSGRYAEFSRHAFDRCTAELNWDAWGRTVRGLAEELV